MPNAAPTSAPGTPSAEAPAAKMAQRLRDVEKTASYLGATAGQKAPTPASMPAAKPQPMRRSSGAQRIPAANPPGGLSAATGSAPQPMRRASGPVVVPPGASGRLKVPTPPPGSLRSAPGAAGTPGASGTRTLAQPKWHCERCRVPLDKEALVQGTCKLVAGEMYCLRCFKKRSASRQLQLVMWAMGGALLVGLALSAVFLTQPLLILLLPIGALAVLTGVVGGGLSGTARLSFVAAGLAAMVGSCWGTGVINERNESRQAVESVQKRATQVEELIETKNIAQADARIELLDAQSKDRAGHYLSREHEQKITRLREHLNAQIKATYGDLSAHEYHVLLALLRAFPDGSDNAQRVRAIHMNDTRVSVSVEKNRDAVSDKDMPQGPQGDPATLQARTLALFLFDSYPFLKEVEVEVAGEKPQRAAYTREQLTQLRMGGMSAPIAIPEAARGPGPRP